MTNLIQIPDAWLVMLWMIHIYDFRFEGVGDKVKMKYYWT